MVVGLAANVALGNWRVKGEAARFSGADYSGFADTTLALEVVNRRIADYDTSLNGADIPEEEWQTAARYQGDFLHARLHFIALASAYGKQLNEGVISLQPLPVSLRRRLIRVYREFPWHVVGLLQ